MDVEATQSTMIECGKISFSPGAFGFTPVGTLHNGKYNQGIEVVVTELYKAMNFVDFYNLNKLVNKDDILNIFGVEESPDAVYIATEVFVATLEEWVLGHYKGHMGSSKDVIHQIGNGLNFFHQKDINFRVLNPSTVFITPPKGSGLPRVKLGYWAFPRRCQDENVTIPLISMMSGLDQKWAAPELLLSTIASFTKEMDIYSYGALIFYILAKKPLDKCLSALQVQLLTEVDTQEQANHAYDLIFVMLNPDPKLRPTITEVLKHFFFKQSTEVEPLAKRLRVEEAHPIPPSAIPQEAQSPLAASKLPAVQLNVSIPSDSQSDMGISPGPSSSSGTDQSSFFGEPGGDQLIEDSGISDSDHEPIETEESTSSSGEELDQDAPDEMAVPDDEREAEGENSSGISAEEQAIKNLSPEEKLKKLFALCGNSRLNGVQVNQFRLLGPDLDIAINETNEEGLTPLLVLSSEQSSDLEPFLSIVLRRQDIDEDAVDGEGRNCLILACLNNKSTGLPKAIDLMLRSGVSVNQVDSEGNNALMTVLKHYPHQTGLEEIVRLLIDNDIDITTTNSRHENALLILCGVYKGDNLGVLIQLLVGAGLDPDQVDAVSNNALILVCENNRNNKTLYNVISILVKNCGIDTSAANSHGMNALFCLLFSYEARTGFSKPMTDLVRIMKLLIKYGADVNRLTTEDCLFPLWNSLLALFSEQYLHRDFILALQVLLDNQVNLEVVDRFGCTALIFLCANYKGNQLIRAVKKLISAGVNVNATCVNGRNALFYLAGNNTQHHKFIPVAQHLINADLDINHQDVNGLNLLHWICQPPFRCNLEEAVDFLVNEESIDCNALDKSGHKPLYYLKKIPRKKRSPKVQASFIILSSK